MRSGRQRMLLASVAALLSLAACGSEDDSGDGAEPTATAADDAEPASGSESSSGGEAPAADGKISCALVTQTDLEAAGLTVEGGPVPEEGPFDQCIHDLLGSGGIPGTFSTRALTEDQHANLAPDVYDDWEDIPGIADTAWYIDGLNLAEARFANGLQISVQETPGDLTRDELLALLSLAVSRV